MRLLELFVIGKCPSINVEIFECERIHFYNKDKEIEFFFRMKNYRGSDLAKQTLKAIVTH